MSTKQSIVTEVRDGKSVRIQRTIHIEEKILEDISVPKWLEGVETLGGLVAAVAPLGPISVRSPGMKVGRGTTSVFRVSVFRGGKISSASSPTIEGLMDSAAVEFDGLDAPVPTVEPLPQPATPTSGPGAPEAAQSPDDLGLSDSDLDGLF